MFESQEYQDDWPPVPKPSAIDDLITEKQIAQLTAEEYLVLTRRAQIALHEMKRVRSPRQ
jgi:hypothetical protein